MNIKVDAKGLACPLPVIKTKKALEGISEGVVEVIVDGDVPKENILKFAKSINCSAVVTKDTFEEKVIVVTKGSDVSIDISDDSISCDVSSFNNEVVTIMSDKMGSGIDELGEVLIKGFLFTLTESDPLPKTVIFINGGVNLTTINESTVEHIKNLENAGVEILSCGTCLDYYGIKDQLKVGSISNMYSIVETMKSASKVITIG